MNWLKHLSLILVIFIAGCPTKPTQPADPPTDSECIFDDAHKTEFVADWTGRSANPPAIEEFYRDVLAPAPGMNFSLFKDYGSPGNPTLESRKEEFKRLVLRKMHGKFKNVKPNDVKFFNGEAEDHPQATKLYIVQSVGEDAKTPGGVGVATVEHGNLRTGEDNAFVLTESILRTADSKQPTFEQWANYIANVGAHEAAHTMGWKHVKTWVCAVNEKDCKQRSGLHGWNLDQEQLELMRGLRGCSVFLMAPRVSGG